MKNLLNVLTVLFIVVLSTTAQQLNSNSIQIKKTHLERYNHIEELAGIEWSTDFNMRVYEINKECDALVEFISTASKLEEDSPEYIILLLAMKEWWYDNRATCNWTMTMYEYKRQLKAYKELK